jgi:hypothetical protein
MPQHATHDCHAAIQPAELVLDFLRALPKLLPLHGAARQQVAVMGRKLIETLAHR